MFESIVMATVNIFFIGFNEYYNNGIVRYYQRRLHLCLVIFLMLIIKD
jgi:hypothetical protein